MTWKVEFDDRARVELRKLDRPIQDRILRFLRERVAAEEDPRRFGEPLRKDFKGLWKYRIGDYRLACSVAEKILTVRVVRVGHRRDIYKRPR